MISNFFTITRIFSAALFLFACILPPSVSQAQICSGNAAAVTAKKGIDSANDAIGEPNATAAQLWDTGDQLLLDLNTQLNAGTTIVITWRGNSLSTTDPTIAVETSSDGINFVAVTGSPLTLTRSLNYFTTHITTPNNTRFVQFTTTNNEDVDLDAVSFTNQACLPVLSTTVNTSGCFDSNGNTTGGTSQANVQVIVDWQFAPNGENIVLKVQGQTDVVIDPTTDTRPFIKNYTFAADGTTKTVDAHYSVSTTVASAQKNAQLPAGNCLLTPCLAGNTGGQVWQDVVNDGQKDPTDTFGVQNVSVHAYDCNGILLGTTTTDAKGQYTFSNFTPSVSNKIRLEFSGLAAPYVPTAAGTGNGTSVQFVSTASCSVNYGVNSPADYCQANPTMSIPCYENAVAAGNSNPGIVSMLYNSSGVPSAYGGTAANPTNDAAISEVGTVWGNAWQKTQKRAFFTSFLKRHSGFADGPGYVYSFDYATAGVPLLKKFDLQGVTPTNGGAAIDLGSVCRSAACASDIGNTGIASDYEMPPSVNIKFVDLDAFAKVGKMSFGDADVDETDQTLWIVNTFQRALIAIDISGNSAASIPANVRQYPIAGLPNLPTCANGILRPWALSFSGGKGYLGCVCDASASKSAADLQAYVLSFDPNNPTAGFSVVYNFPLNYNRETGHQQSNTAVPWQFWANTWAEARPFSAPQDNNYMAPQPILSDIDFTADGSMVLGFLDRFGNQNSRANTWAVSGDTHVDDTNSSGDIVKICKTAALGYVLEGATGCPTSDNNAITGDPSNTLRQDDGALNRGEFFYDDYLNNNTSGGGSYLHAETATGALAINLGTNEVVSTHFDPSSPSTRFNTQGVVWHNTLVGNRTRSYEIVDMTPGGTNTTFGKSNGLGDLQLLCDALPIEIGNYVWNDADRDGVQDPCEYPLSNVKVSLYKNGVKIAETTTQSNGEYYFSSQFKLGAGWIGTGADTILQPSTAYNLVFGETQFASNQLTIGNSSYVLTVLNGTTNNGNDQNDSDATETAIGGGSFPVIHLTTPSVGSNHTFDVGFSISCPPIICLPVTLVKN